ncbi:MAG: insulinase family protein [Flavobacteriales bacterium]|nr:insulinase family protein [Flavobacteriales bacterium]
MIQFERFVLENGLRVLVHQDQSTPIAAFNLLYDVGAKDESPEQTGFAHLFEHLMFGGSVNIPSFDTPLQEVGGQNNAFTSNDITNYYSTLPVTNLETAFWLDSDRMLSLAFTDKSLEVQRSVVIEEFKQRYLNQPYGDVWLLLRPLAYKSHPYQWATIGKEIKHIEDAVMQDVKAFFHKHYGPQNAILCVAGDVQVEEVRELAEKYFGTIPKGEKYIRNIKTEPVQKEYRELTVERDVPANAIYKAYHMCARMDDDYYATDLISDILSRGDSSRLYYSLVKEQELFTEISAFVMGSHDNGLFVVTGKTAAGVDVKEADLAIEKELEKLRVDLVSDRELQKVKNKFESTKLFGEMSALNKAMNLCFFELFGDASGVNSEFDKYNEVTPDGIRNTAVSMLVKENCSTLFYLSKKKNQ